MELTYDLVVYGKMKVLGTTGTYPSDNNCYRVEITYPGKRPKGAVDWVAEYFPKPVYEMWKNLSVASKILNKEVLVGLIDSFNEYGDWKYYQGSADESMSISEDI